MFYSILRHGCNALRFSQTDHWCQFLRGRSINSLHTPEFPQEFSAGFGADAGDLFQGVLGGLLAFEGAVVADGEAVRFVADALEELGDVGGSERGARGVRLTGLHTRHSLLDRQHFPH